MIKFISASALKVIWTNFPSNLMIKSEYSDIKRVLILNIFNVWLILNFISITNIFQMNAAIAGTFTTRNIVSNIFIFFTSIVLLLMPHNMFVSKLLKQSSVNYYYNKSLPNAFSIYTDNINPRSVMITGMFSDLNNVASFLWHIKVFWRSKEHVASFHMFQQTAKIQFNNFQLIRDLTEKILAQKSQFW